MAAAVPAAVELDDADVEGCPGRPMLVPAGAASSSGWFDGCRSIGAGCRFQTYSEKWLLIWDNAKL